MTKAKAKNEFYKDTTIPNTLLDELMKQLPAMPTQEDLFGPEGVVKQLSAALIERCLQAELSTHLGYEKNQRAEAARPNHRNGYSRKTLKSDAGEVEIAIPRDREGGSMILCWSNAARRV
ncbi:MAG TPA: transposase [Ktedonobacteraceae bacterium]|nr:transposase [Ktedonobacteraceae bacterium]